ncbi:MAG TPA: hypothetical protein VID51_05285 [Solirubrobacterales bacterium]
MEPARRVRRLSAVAIPWCTISPRKLSAIAILSSLALLAALPACCAANDDLTLADAQAFDAYHLYYSGPEVAGLSLDAVVQGWATNRHAREQGRRRIYWTFIYGDCTPPPREGGCAPPLEVQVWSACVRSVSPIKVRKHRLYEFRGAKATGGGGRYEVSPMEIFTGRTTIIVFGSEKSLIKTAARELREVHQAQAAPRLSPPARGFLQQKLPCQRKRR